MWLACQPTTVCDVYLLPNISRQWWLKSGWYQVEVWLGGCQCDFNICAMVLWWWSTAAHRISLTIDWLEWFEAGPGQAVRLLLKYWPGAVQGANALPWSWIDRQDTVQENESVSEPVLSQFCCVFLIKDQVCHQWFQVRSSLNCIAAAIASWVYDDDISDISCVSITTS